MKLDAAWLHSAEVKTLAAAFTKAGFELRFVGGCVRDTILGITPHELDAATNALPEQTTKLLENAGLRAIPTGIDHGTVTAHINGKNFEITTLRKDVATDGRHAEVAYTDQWEEDAKRRDFTMNALYLGMDGALYDPVNGLEDCKARRVKFIGDASQRIREDYLRILRYFRFVAQVGDNQFDDAALAACVANKQGIAQLSGERIATELLKLLAAKRSQPAIEKLAPLLPAPLLFSTQGQVGLDETGASAFVKLAALIGDAAKISAVAERLKLSTKQSRSLMQWLGHYQKMTPGMSELEQKKLVRKLGGEDYLATVQLASALTGKDLKSIAAMHAWQPPIFPVKAEDLVQLGFKEGKELGDKLKELENRWEESGYKLNREELL